MRRRRFGKLIILFVLLSMILSGCSGDEAQTEDSGNTDEYAEYIHSALESVNKDPNETEPVQTESTEKPAKVIQLAETDDSVYVSAEENLPEDSGVIPDFEPIDSSADLSSQGGSDASATPTPTPTPTGTPDTFDVDTCCIYIKCEDDSAYGSELITAINKARTDLGYPALNENAGLALCADRRTREVYTRFGHVRPNGKPFYSVAPQYFKAELLAVDASEAEKTFDAWMMDPVSRKLIYTTTYGSIGAACIKCNGLYCVVVAFGD